jgi:nucleoside-triphosphatase THEP1
MEMKNKIYIYSDAIQTGKTTRVLTWVNDKENVFGILTPDIADKRKLYNIAERQLLTFEVEPNTKEEVEVIGKFTFLKSVFQKAQQILKDALYQKADWLIIDEIGKLELEGKGLEPTLTTVLYNFSEQSPKTKILLIIRDTLLEKAIERYNLQNSLIVDYTYFIKQKNKLV